MLQRPRPIDVESLSSALAKPASGSKAEAAVRQYLFSPVDANRAAKRILTKVEHIVDADLVTTECVDADIPDADEDDQVIVRLFFVMLSRACACVCS